MFFDSKNFVSRSFFVFWQNVFQKNVTYNVHVEWKGICSWVKQFIRLCLPIIGPHRVPDSAPKDFVQDNPIFKHNSALIINIKLCPWLFLAQLEWVLLYQRSHVIDRQKVSLVSTRPDDQVRLLDVGSLIVHWGGLEQLDAFLLARNDRLIQIFGITPEASKRV